MPENQAWCKGTFKYARTPRHSGSDWDMEGRKLAGRPVTTAKEGEKATLGIRASASLKEQLLSAAEVTGRSLSAEAEFRLERSFLFDRLLNTDLIEVMQELDLAGRAYAQQHDVEDWTQ